MHDLLEAIEKWVINVKEKFVKYVVYHAKFIIRVSPFQEGESTRSDFGSDDGVSSDDGDIQELEGEGDSDEHKYFQEMTEDEWRVHDWKMN